MSECQPAEGCRARYLEARITELKAEVEGLRIANKELHHDKAGLAGRMVEAASQMTELLEGQQEIGKQMFRDGEEIAALRAGLQEAEKTYGLNKRLRKLAAREASDV